MDMDTVKVKVKVFMTLREQFGWKEKIIELDKNSSTFKDLMDKVPEIAWAIDKYRGERWSLIILVNGRNIEFLDKENTILKDGDVVALFPPLAGG
jgi:molybdopterin synthase sulfur carrier subunit